LRKPGRGKPHSKRTCELLTTPRFGRYLRQTKRGLVKIDMAAVPTEEKLDGKWVITSNDDTLSAEDLALGYKQLMRVEQCWRQIKSGLRTRPILTLRQKVKHSPVRRSSLEIRASDSPAPECSVTEERQRWAFHP
jgi:hypothetical protein